MKSKTTRFLVLSLALILALCLVVFGFLAFYMN